MKVAFPLRNKRELAIDFVRCHAIGIYDDSSQRIEYLSIQNNENITSNQLFENIKLQGVDCVISPYFSCNALRTFKESNIKTYKAQGEALEGNLVGLFSRALTLFNVFDTLFFGECSSDCQGCGPR